MEQAGIVFLIGLTAQSAHKTVVDVLLLTEFEQLPTRLQPTILGHSQEDDPVNDPLNGGVEVVCRQIAVAQGEISRQYIAPAFDVLQELAVNLGGASLAFGGGILVECPGPDGLAREHVPNLPPTVRILAEPEILDAGMAGLIAGVGARGAIVHAQFLEVGKDGQGKFGAEAVAAKLIGRCGIAADIDAALLGFDVELRQCADAEGVVRRLLVAFHIQTLFGDDFAILGCGHGVVAHVPTKGFEKRIYERLADVGFLDTRGKEGLPVRGEVLTQPSTSSLPWSNILLISVQFLSSVTSNILTPNVPADLAAPISLPRSAAAPLSVRFSLLFADFLHRSK